MIAGVIKAHEVSKTLEETPNPTPEVRREVAGQLAQTIKDVTEAANGSTQANPVLTQLHLARAAITENDREKRYSESEAIQLSLVSLRLPTSVRVVERPISLARKDSVSLEQNPIQSTTTREQ
jgi:hypothetical protein